MMLVIVPPQLQQVLCSSLISFIADREGLSRKTPGSSF